MFKKQNGITLIALVITIIVLLILAGVSISLVVGENGVLNKASTAKEETIISQESETVKLAAAAAKVDTLGGEILEENLARELTNTIGTRDVDYSLEESGEDFVVTYLDTNRAYLVSKDGTITQRGKWYTSYDTNIYSTIVTDGIQVFEVGDVVYYDHLTGANNTSYTSTSEKNGYENQTFDLNNANTYPTNVEDGLWRILGVNHKGQILLIANNEVKTNEGNAFELVGQNGYSNAVTELNNISKLFGQGYGAESARSITMDDINKITGYNPETENYGAGKKYEYGNEIDVYWSGTGQPYFSASNGITGRITNSHKDLEGNSGFSWYEKGSWKYSAYPEMTETENINEMKKITTMKNTFYEYNPADYMYDESKAYDALFNKGYYTATPYICIDDPQYNYGLIEVAAGCQWGATIGYWNYGVATSNNFNDGKANPVCPVVTLNENVKLTGSSESGWTIVK